MTLIVEVLGQLDVQPGLQHALHQRAQQTIVAGQLDPWERARSTSASAQACIASSPTNETPRIGGMTDDPDIEIIEVAVVIGNDPLQPAASNRGPLDHAHLHTQPECHRKRAGAVGQRATDRLLCSALTALLSPSSVNVEAA